VSCDAPSHSSRGRGRRHESAPPATHYCDAIGFKVRRNATSLDKSSGDMGRYISKSMTGTSSVPSGLTPWVLALLTCSSPARDPHRDFLE